MLGMFPVAEEPGITNNPLVFTVWVLHAKDFAALHADDSFPFICSDLSDKWFRSRWFTESWSDAAFTSIFFGIPGTSIFCDQCLMVEYLHGEVSVAEARTIRSKQVPRHPAGLCCVQVVIQTSKMRMNEFARHNRYKACSLEFVSSTPYSVSSREPDGRS